MRPKILKTLFLFLCFTSINFSISAQTKPEKKPETKQVHIEMTDGNFVDGKLMARRGDTVVVESATLGMLNLNIKNIKNIDALTAENFKDGKYWFDNVHAIHGFVTSTAFNLRKGEGYYGNIFLFFNYVGYGFTDYFSLTAGTEFLSTLAGENSGGPAFFFLNPKFSFKADKNLTIGAGALIAFGNSNVFDNRQTLAIPYAVVTLGNRNNNLSVGVASPLGDNSNGSSSLLFTVSGQARLSRGVALMSENFIATDSNPNSVSNSNFGISGFRFMGKTLAFNVGLMYSFGRSGDNIFGSGDGGSPFVPIPFLGLSVAFGSKKR